MSGEDALGSPNCQGDSLEILVLGSLPPLMPHLVLGAEIDTREPLVSTGDLADAWSPLSRLAPEPQSALVSLRTASPRKPPAFQDPCRAAGISCVNTFFVKHHLPSFEIVKLTRREEIL